MKQMKELKRAWSPRGIQFGDVEMGRRIVERVVACVKANKSLKKKKKKRLRDI